MTGIVDTHTHLDSFYRKGLLEDALTAAANAGIRRMITVGTEPSDWSLYRDLANERRGLIDFTVGLHPCSVEMDWETAVGKLERYFVDSEVRPTALGEIGLDRFHLPRKDAIKAAEIFARQEGAFAAQLEIAKRLEAPVVIHSRGAFEECVALIDASGVDWSRVVFHCFSEGPGEMEQLKERGGFGSFTGIITFKNAESIREAALLQGLERAMVETDAPYLAPMPHRGKPNEPAYAAHTAKFCAELFGVSENEFAEKSTARAVDFYGLK